MCEIYHSSGDSAKGQLAHISTPPRGLVARPLGQIIAREERVRTSPSGINTLSVDAKRRGISQRMLITLLAMLILVAGMLALVGCDAQPINRYDYIPEYFSYHEPEKDSMFIEHYQASYTETNRAGYYFVETIKKKQRNEFVTYSELILDRLEAYQSDKATICFFVGNSFYPRTQVEFFDGLVSTVYMSIKETKSMTHINYILQAICGESVNYGLLYGISARTYKKLGWGKLSEKSDAYVVDQLSQFDNQYLLDLTYPVFSSRFSSSDRISLARSIAIKLNSFITIKYGDSAFKFLLKENQQPFGQFEATFYGYLNEWLDSVGLGELSHAPQAFRSSSYTEDFPIIIYTPTISYYIHKNWKESFLPQVDSSYSGIENNYSTLIQYLLELEKQYEAVELFLAPDRVSIDLSIRLDDSVSMALWWSWMTVPSLRQILYGFSCIRVNQILGENATWLYGFLITYCDNTFNPIAQLDMEVAFKDVIKNGTDSSSENYLTYFWTTHQYYYELFGSDFEFERFFYCYAYVHTNIAEQEIFYYNYARGQYLISNYPLSALIDYYKTGSLAGYGQSLEELESQFLDFLNQSFDIN